MNSQKCNHSTNGSLEAFTQAFRGVAGRNPQRSVDYFSCCPHLSDWNSKTLTEEQLAQCRVYGEEKGSEAIHCDRYWKQVKLRFDEVEHLVRWHAEAEVELYIEEHFTQIEGTCIPKDTLRDGQFAFSRQDDFYLEGGFGERVNEIRCEVFQEKIGEFIMKCHCTFCLRERNWVFPDKKREWEHQSRGPKWREFAKEAHRQFPRMSRRERSLLVQRTIQGGKSPEPVAEAVLQAAILHARWELGLEWAQAYGPGGNAPAPHNPELLIDELLAKWSAPKALVRDSMY